MFYRQRAGFLDQVIEAVRPVKNRDSLNKLYRAKIDFPQSAGTIFLQLTWLQKRCVFYPPELRTALVISQHFKHGVDVFIDQPFHINIKHAQARPSARE